LSSSFSKLITKLSSKLNSKLFSSLLLSILLFNSASVFAVLTIGSWNIRDLSNTKGGRPAVVDEITDIGIRYDIFVIQELDVSPDGSCGANTSPVICTILDDMNTKANPAVYSMTVSPVVGFGMAGEQYAFIYKSSNGISILEEFVSPNPVIWRNPYSVRFQAGADTFFISSIHARPDSSGDATRIEIQEFAKIANSLQAAEPEGDVILVGDFNADCNYFTTPGDWTTYFYNTLNDGNAWTHQITDGMDTNFFYLSAQCTYDRIVTSPSLSGVGTVASAGPYFFAGANAQPDCPGAELDPIKSEGCMMGYLDCDAVCIGSGGQLSKSAGEKVSDHWPVEMVINLGGADVTPPVVVSGTPSGINIPWNTTTVTVTFNEAMDGGSFSTSSITVDGGASVDSFDGLSGGNTIATFTISGLPATETTHTVTVVANQVEDLGGSNNMSADDTFQFTTVEPDKLLISEVGNRAGAPPTGPAENDFILLYNPTDHSVDMTGMYWGRDSTCNLGNGWTTFEALPSIVIPSNMYYLISRAANTLPNPSDYDPAWAIGTGGDCVVVASNSTPPTAWNDSNVLDFAAFNGSTGEGGTSAGALLEGNPSFKRLGACKDQDTDDNNADFTSDNAPAPENSTFAACPADATLPAVTSWETADVDMDGYIDAIKIAFTEDIDDTSVTATDFDVDGYSGEGFSSTTNGDVADNDYIYITFNQLGTPDTDVTPGVTYTAGSLTDLLANAMGSTQTAAASDAAPPVLISALSDRSLFNGNLQTGTQLTLVFSEYIYSNDPITIFDFKTEPDGLTPTANLAGAGASFLVIGGNVIITLTSPTTSDNWDGNAEIDLDTPGADRIEDVLGLDALDNAVLIEVPLQNIFNICALNPGEVIVNEVLVNSYNDDPEADEYIELYNTTDTLKDLSGCYLDDQPDADGPSKDPYKFPPGTTIDPYGLRVFSRGDTAVALNNTSNCDKARVLSTVVEYEGLDTVLDEIAFCPPHTEGYSLGREWDGASSFAIWEPTFLTVSPQPADTWPGGPIPITGITNAYIVVDAPVSCYINENCAVTLTVEHDLNGTPVTVTSYNADVDLTTAIGNVTPAIATLTNGTWSGDIVFDSTFLGGTNVNLYAHGAGSYYSTTGLDTLLLQAHASISSAADQYFMAGDPTTLAEEITVAEGDGTNITSGNDIRITIPATFNMTWDNTINSATCNMTGAGSVNCNPGQVTYEDGDRTVRINVTGNFAANDYVKITGLRFFPFTASSAPDNLELEVDNGGTVIDEDDKIKQIGATIQFLLNSSYGDEGTTPAVLEVYLTDTSPANVLVDYTVTGGTADGNGTDYTLAVGTVTILTGQTTASFNITIVDDLITESDETIEVTLSNAQSGALGSQSVHYYSIVDNDGPILVQCPSTYSADSRDNGTKNDGDSTDKVGDISSDEYRAAVECNPDLLDVASGGTIPDGSTITKVELRTIVTKSHSSMSFDVFEMALRPTSATDAQLYADAADDVEYVSLATHYRLPGQKFVDLGADAVDDFQTIFDADQNWFAAGLTFVGTTEDAAFAAFANAAAANRPYFRISYTPPGVVPAPGPAITAFVADDPDNLDGVYSNGDTITVTFSESTNKPIAAAKADIDALFTISEALGTDYTGAWNAAGDILTITVVNATGALPPVIGSLTFTVLAAANLQNAANTSAASTSASAGITGDWGVISPSITTLVADDPDDLDVIYSIGDTITITFDQTTNKPTVATKADIDNCFTFNEVLGTNAGAYTGAWNGGGDILTITIADITGATPPAIGTLTATVNLGCNLLNAAATSDPSVSASGGITGDWGIVIVPPAISAFVADDPDNADVIYSNGDTITITFDMNTNQPAVATMANLDTCFTFSQVLGTNAGAYTGVWTTAAILTITINDITGSTPPAIGVLTATVKVGCNLQNAPATSGASTAASGGITGDWGFISAADIIIAELGNSIDSDTDNDYILLYNPTGSAIDITGYRVYRDSNCATSGGAWSNEFPLDTNDSSIAAYTYYLIGRDSNTLSNAPDLENSSWSMDEDDCVAITNNSTDPTAWDDSQVVDWVTLDNGTDPGEGGNNTADDINTDDSISRKGTCKEIDTDDNDADFDTKVDAPAHPPNSSTTCTITAPTIVSASIDTVISGGDIQSGAVITLVFTEAIQSSAAIVVGDFKVEPDGATPTGSLDGATATFAVVAGNLEITFTSNTTGGNWDGSGEIDISSLTNADSIEAVSGSNLDAIDNVALTEVPIGGLVASPLIIAELGNNIDGGTNNEYILLYNPSSSAVDITGYRVYRDSNCSTSGGSWSEEFPLDTNDSSIAAYTYYLIGRTGSTLTNAPDLLDGSWSLNEDDCVAITDDSNDPTAWDDSNVIDWVTLDNGTDPGEGGTNTADDINADDAISRKGSCKQIDTDDNNADFDSKVDAPPHPPNSSTTCTVSPPTIVSASIDTVISGGDIQSGAVITLVFTEAIQSSAAIVVGDFKVEPDGATPTATLDGATATFAVVAGNLEITFTSNTTSGTWDGSGEIDISSLTNANSIEAAAGGNLDAIDNAALTEVPISGLVVIRLVISEIGNNIDGDADNDYALLYNPTSVAVDITGYRFYRDADCDTSGGAWTQEFALDQNDSSIAAYTYYLVGIPANTLTNAPDLEQNGWNFNGDDCFAITNNSTDPTAWDNANVVDWVTLDNGTDPGEGGNNTIDDLNVNDESIPRKGSCKEIDTDDNAADFDNDVATPPHPPNSSTTCVPDTTAPTLVSVTLTDAPNSGAANGDTITLVYDEALDPASIVAALIPGNTNNAFATGSGNITGDIDDIIAELGSFATATTATSDAATLELLAGGTTIVITLAGTTTHGIFPAGDFTPAATYTSSGCTKSWSSCWRYYYY